MSGKLTTHVLDTTGGCPAANLAIALWSIAPDGERTLIKTVYTNQDGRTDAPLLVGDEFTVQVYELVFQVGEYFKRSLKDLPDPMFLNEIPIRFGVADPTLHYHVPLLTSPWAYSTYRGS